MRLATWNVNSARTRVDRILARCERALSEHWSRLERDADQNAIDALRLRLGASAAAVRRLALGCLGALANRRELLQAVEDALRRWDVDDETARLVAGLPLSPDSRRRLAEGLACRAGALPDFLISALLGLRITERPDTGLLEHYLSQANPGGATLILRYWPQGRPPSESTLRHLLDQDDERVLAPLLSAMKQRFPSAALRFRERIGALAEHPSPAVRVWSRALLALKGSV